VTNDLIEVMVIATQYRPRNLNIIIKQIPHMGINIHYDEISRSPDRPECIAITL